MIVVVFLCGHICFKVVGLAVSELGVMCQETFSEIYRLVKKKTNPPKLLVGT